MANFEQSGSFWRNAIQNRDLFYWSSISKRYLLAWFTGNYENYLLSFISMGQKKNSREFDFSILRVYLCPIIKFPNLDVFAALKCAQGLNSKVLKEVRKMCKIV